MSKEPIKRTTSRTVELLLAEIETLTRKGEELCDAYGKSLIQIHDLTAKVKRYEEALISIRDINCKDQVQYMNQEFALYSIHTIARAALNQGGGE